MFHSLFSRDEKEFWVQPTLLLYKGLSLKSLGTVRFANINMFRATRARDPDRETSETSVLSRVKCTVYGTESTPFVDKLRSSQNPSD